MKVLNFYLKYKKKIKLIILVYFFVLTMYSVLFFENDIEKKFFLYATTLLGCVIAYFLNYSLLWIMMKLPITSKKMMKGILRKSVIFWGICLIIYLPLHFISGFSRLAYGIPIIGLADLRLLEQLEMKYKDE